MTGPFDPPGLNAVDPSVVAATGGAPGGSGSMWGGLSPLSPLHDHEFRRRMMFDAIGNAGLSLIKASAPSYGPPQDFGSMFGALAGGALEGVRGSADRYKKEIADSLAIANARQQMEINKQILPMIQGAMGGQGAGGSAGGAAPPQGGPQTATGPNPFNIGNVRPPGATTGFQQPPDFASGVKLAVQNAQSYPEKFNNGQHMTLEQIAARWAPKGDGANDPTQWARNVSTISGLPADQPLNLNDPATAAKFARGVHGAEWGGHAVQPETAYAGALQGQPPPQGGGPQMAQAGPPQPPPGQPGASFPQPTPGAPAMPPPIGGQPNYAPLTLLPQYKAFGEAMTARQKMEQEEKYKRIELNNKLIEMSRGNANADITIGPDGQPQLNQNKIEFDTRKKVGEAKATEEARKEAVFGGKDWEKFTPEELRKRANPEALSLVEQVQSGQTKIGDISARAGAGGVSVSKNDVLALGKKLYGEEWDPNAGERRQKFEADTTDTSSQTGKTLFSVNTVYKHIDRFQDLTVALHNKQTPLYNEILRAWNNQTGNPKYKTAEALQHALATEIANVIKGQQLNLPEVESAVDTIKTTQSPQQMAGALGVLRHAMGDRESTILWAARRAKVPEGRIKSLIDPDARKAIEHFDEVNAEVAKPPAAPASGSAPAITEGATATNPQTGQKIIFRGGQWGPAQ